MSFFYCDQTGTKIQYFPQDFVLVRHRPLWWDTGALNRHTTLCWFNDQIFNQANCSVSMIPEGNAVISYYTLHTYTVLSSEHRTIIWSTKNIASAARKPIAICCLLPACPVTIKAVCHNDPDPWSSPSPVFTWGCRGDAGGYHGNVQCNDPHLLSSTEWDMAVPCHSHRRIRWEFQRGNSLPPIPLMIL